MIRSNGTKSSQAKSTYIMTRAAEVMLAGASYLTSLTGAFEQIAEIKPLAFLLASGLQLMLYASAHSLDRTQPQAGRKYSPSLRLFVWIMCLTFSVWLSYLGTFKISKASVESANQHAAFQTVAYQSALDLNQFRSAALSFLNTRLVTVRTQLATENARITFAQKQRRSYSRRQIERLLTQQQQLISAIKQLEALQSLDSSIPSGDLKTSRRQQDEVFRQAAEAYALMPEEFQQSHSLPQPTAEVRTSSDLQTLAWQELKKRSPAAIFFLFVAFLLDIVPTLSVRARTPMRKAATVIRDSLLWTKIFFGAFRPRYAVEAEVLRIKIEDYPDLEIEILFDKEDMLMLENLRPHLESVERLVSENKKQPMHISAITASSGLELIPDLPLAAQVDQDFTIRVRLEPTNAGVKV